MYNISLYPLACKQRWVFNMLIACIPSIFIVFMRVLGLKVHVRLLCTNNEMKTKIHIILYIFEYIDETVNMIYKLYT